MQWLVKYTQIILLVYTPNPVSKLQSRHQLTVMNYKLCHARCLGLFVQLESKHETLNELTPDASSSLLHPCVKQVIPQNFRTCSSCWSNKLVIVSFPSTCNIPFSLSF